MILLLTVRVEYEPAKIEELQTMDERTRLMKIRQDLDLLKLPHPPDANIREPTKHGIVVAWVTHECSTLYKKILSTVDRQNIDEDFRNAKSQSRMRGLIITHQQSLSGPSLKYSPPYQQKVSSLPGARSPQDSNDGKKHNHRIPTTSPPHCHEFQTKYQPAVSRQQISLLPSSNSQRSPTKIAIPSGPTHNLRKDKLKRELLSVHLQIEGAILKASKIEAELERLCSPYESASPEESYSRLSKATAELMHEKKRRQQAELQLADVQRECARPSIVPMLAAIAGSEILQS